MANESSPGPLEKLATSRARFIAELGERIAAARQGLVRIGPGAADPGAELNGVRRRLHALAAAADVLHFTTAADALRRAEAELATGAAAPSLAPARERVMRILDLVPSLALGASVALEEELSGERANSAREPVFALIFGGAPLEAALDKPGPLHGTELHRTDDPEALSALIGQLGPDVIVLDAAHPGLAELVPRLRQPGAPGLLPLVAVGGFDSYDTLQRLVRRGVARVLPAPVDPGALQRTLRELAPRGPAAPPLSNPLSDAGPASLVDAITAEARRAFALPGSGSIPTLALGSDPEHQALSALWSAFARIRSLALRASEGRVRLPLAGPYGMIPLAPALVDAGAGRAGAPPGLPGEALAGRRLVVADTDLTLLGALSRTLQRLGASVLPARDAGQALDLVERHWPDAVIADVQLPPFGGLELCRRVREDIALCDVPVALICWKEDLLQHARRVSEGRGEPRPLDADAFAPLGEALARRLLLERRLEQEGAARGRLDGLSPRLLLELCSSRASASLLTLRSGRLGAELAMVDGRPLHARLLEAGAPVAEGAAALAPLLGMRSGRFRIEPLGGAPAPHFSGDLATVLAPSIARSRRAHALLASAGLKGVERAELEPRVAAHYLDEAPPAQRAVLARVLRGETLRALRAAESGDSAGPSALSAALLELSRRGGVLALFDADGADALASDAERVRSAERALPSRRDNPPMPAAQTLAEAVLQAVSAPNGEPGVEGRRTQRGLAPPGSEANADSGTAEPRGLRSQPREVPEAWSSEPAPGDELGSQRPADDAELDEAPPPATSGARLRSIVSPVLVTLGAAALAFAGMRLVLGGTLDLGVLPWVRTSTPPDGTGEVPSPAQPPSAPGAVPSDGAPPDESSTLADAATEVPPGSGATSPEPGLAGDAGAPAEAAAEAVPGVTFSSELLDPPPTPALAPGQGLLELSTWEPQRLYVDHVFVGNYAARLIPLAPGLHRIRFGTTTREFEQSVTISAGRRTRLSVRLEKAP